MEPKFIELTQAGGTDVYHLNVTHILHFRQSSGGKGTYMIFVTDKPLSFKESPDEIRRMISDAFQTRPPRTSTNVALPK